MTRKRKARLKSHKASKRGRPPVSGSKIRTISRMLTQKADVQAIARAVGLSRTTVDRIRADYNALTYETALSRLELGDSLPDIEYKRAEIRARIVEPRVRAAIIKGIADAFRAEDILDPVPSDPRLAFAPQKVDPEHKPVVVRGKLQNS